METKSIQVSGHTLKAKRREKIAKSIIIIFAGLTIAVLVWIVGYILFRGFYYDKKPQYDVLNIKESSIFLDNDTEEIVFISNKEIKTDDMTIYDLRTLFTKPRRENWGFYTTQNIKVNPFAFQKSSGNNFAEKANAYITAFADDFSKYTKYVTSPEEMNRRVAETAGSIGYVPKSYAENLQDVTIINVRRFAIVVHPSVLEVKNNERLLNLTESQVKNIFTGKVTNWQDIDGINLPVIPVYLHSDKGEYYISDMVSNKPGELPVHGLSADSKEEFLNYISDTTGSVGIVEYSYAIEKELPVVKVERRETGLNLTLDFLLKPPSRSGQWGGISYIIINTFFLILFTLVFSTPIGIAAAVYLVEYAKQGRFVNILRMGTETLAAIPSIVFGLFGYIFFVQICGFGIGFISSTLSVTLMILPTIIRTTEESLKSVPASFREGSLALGSTKLQTIFKVVIPAASPGIVTGIILGIGRTIGETAVLLYTLGSSYDLVRSATSSARVLSLHLYLLFSEAISFERAFATGAVLVFIVLIVNYSTTKIVGRMNRMSGKK